MDKVNQHPIAQRNEFVGIKEAMERLKIKRTVLWQLSKTPDFPKLVKITAQRKAFVASELDDWIQARIDARNTKDAA